MRQNNLNKYASFASPKSSPMERTLIAFLLRTLSFGEGRVRLLIIFFLLPLYCVAQTADTYVQAGNQKAGQKDYKGAIADFTKAIQLDGGRKATAYFYRANAYSNINDNAAAIQDYNKAIELEPANATAYFYR